MCQQEQKYSTNELTWNEEDQFLIHQLGGSQMLLWINCCIVYSLQTLRCHYKLELQFKP